MSATPKLGAKVRALRRRESLTQAAMARKLEISASYLNLIEGDRRPLTAPLLIKLATLFDVDIQNFATMGQTKTTAELMEMFSDPLFDSDKLLASDVRNLAANHTDIAESMLDLYRAYQATRDSRDALATKVLDTDQDEEIGTRGFPSEEVNSVIQSNRNYFQDLEDGSDQLRKAMPIEELGLYGALIDHLGTQLGIRVEVVSPNILGGAIRKYNSSRRLLQLSEIMEFRSRTFQLAHQIALLTQNETLSRIAQDPRLTTKEARVLCRIVLANYFAGAVMMPYRSFLHSAKDLRYDMELLGRRYNASWEQVCHRLTSLQRPGHEGVPFHFVRIDIAGNISKQFSTSGITFARFSGVCPKWAVHASFLTPGRIQTQISEMPDGARYFCVSRTIRKGTGGYSTPHPILAVGMGCRLEHAPELVYADSVQLDRPEDIVTIGVTCRLCDRMNCISRAAPSIQQPLQIDEDLRGPALYAHVPKS